MMACSIYILNIGSTWCWWIDKRHLATNSCCPAAPCVSHLAKQYSDHHYHPEGGLRSFIGRWIRRDLAMIGAAEKDAVRMPPLPEAEVKVPIYFLRVEIEILSGHESWEHCVARICKPQPMLSPERFFA